MSSVGLVNPIKSSKQLKTGQIWLHLAYGKDGYFFLMNYKFIIIL